MSKSEKIHSEIHARFQFRIVAASLNRAILANDTTRTIHTLEIQGKAFRLAWYAEILKRLADGEKPTKTDLEYRQYAR